MTLEQVAYVAEIGGAVVVAVTLIFLTVQMRQNNKMLRSAATQHAHSEFGHLYDALISDPSLVELFFRANEDFAALTASEKGWMNAFWMKATINYQNWVFQTQEGALDGNLLDSYERLLTAITAGESYREFWKARGHVFESQVMMRVDELLRKSTTDPYEPFGVT